MFVKLIRAQAPQRPPKQFLASTEIQMSINSARPARGSRHFGWALVTSGWPRESKPLLLPKHILPSKALCRSMIKGAHEQPEPANDLHDPLLQAAIRFLHGCGILRLASPSGFLGARANLAARHRTNRFDQRPSKLNVQLRMPCCLPPASLHACPMRSH